MSESESVDSTQEEQEQPDANQEVSQTTEVSEEVHLPEGAALAEQTLKDEVATETLRRHFQGTKDKGVAEAHKVATEALTEVERLKTYFSEEDQQLLKTAQLQMVLDDIYAERYSPPVPGTEQQVEAQAPASSIDVLAAFTKAKYDLNTVTVADLDFADGFKDQNELEKALLRRNREKPADPGSIVQPGGGGVIPTKVDKEALNAEFNSLDGKPMDMKLDSGQTVRERRAEIAKLVK